jgi:single-strand DNA-binding protein
MASVNKAIIVGNLGGDPELRHTGSGTAVANFSVATTEKWKDKQTGEPQEETEWHRIVFYGRQAEVISEYMRKGRPIYVEGRIKTDKYTDKQGIERYSTKIIGSDFQMLGSNDGGERKPASGGQRQQGNDYGTRPPAAPPASNFDDDDIPF